MTSTLGEKLRALENNTQERDQLIERARREHAEFWQKWYPFRCTEEGDQNGRAFWHVVNLIDRDLDPDGTQGLFTKFMGSLSNVLVVDIAGGLRPSLINVLMNYTPDLAGYVLLEPPKNEQLARANFDKAGYSKLFKFIPWDFWESYPADAIAKTASERGATRVVTMTYWGATYLPRHKIRDWIKSASTVSDVIYINMLTHGRFNPDVLRKKYPPLLLKLLFSGKIGFKDAGRAVASLRTMRSFGEELSPLMPLWTAEELQAMLSDICTINRTQNAVMGQTMFLELHPKA